MRKAELFQAGQKTFLLLAAKHPEYEFRGVSSAAPRHHGENKAREIGVIEVGDAAPSQPFCLVGAAGRLDHRHPRTPCFRNSMQRLSIHTNFMAKTANIGLSSAL